MREQAGFLKDITDAAAVRAEAERLGIVNAVLDALRPLGVTDFDMPASSARVWEAIQSAKR